MASQITGVSIVGSTIIEPQVNENIKAPRHWRCEGNPPVTGGFLSQRASNAEMFPFDDVIMYAGYLTEWRSSRGLFVLTAHVRHDTV